MNSVSPVSDAVSFAVLGADLGAIVRTGSAQPDTLLRSLVSSPHETVSALLGESAEDFEGKAQKLVSALASAPDEAARKAIKRGLPAWCSAEFKPNGRRCGADFVSRQIVGLDFDEVVAESWEGVLAQVRAKLPGLFVAIHTTPTERNPDGTWRVRPYVVLDRPVTSVDEWNTRVKPWMRSLGIQDEGALDAVRFHFLPIRTAGYRSAVIEGARLCLDELLAEATAAESGPRIVEGPSTRTAMAGSTDARWAEAAGLFARALPPYGARNSAKVALYGAFWRDKQPVEDCVKFLKMVYAHVDSPDGGGDFAKNARDTYRRGDAGTHVTGWNTLGGLMDAGIVQAVRDLLNFGKSEENHAQLEARAEATDTTAAASSTEITPISFRFGGWQHPPAPTEFLVEGLVPKSCIGMVFGRADTNKTWLVYSLALALSEGRPWLGHYVTHQAKVGIVDFETGANNCAWRLHKLGAGDNRNLGAVSFPNLKPNDPKFWLACHGHGFDILFVDSLRKANPGANENDSHEAIRPLELAAEFSEKTGCAVFFIHHATKSSDDGWPCFRGSSAIEDQVDVSFAVRKTDTSADRQLVEVKCGKPGDMRSPEPFAVEVSFDDVAQKASVRLAAAAAEKTAGATADPQSDHAELRAAIKLRLMGESFASVREISQALGRRKDAVREAVEILEARHEVVKLPAGYVLDDPAKRRARLVDAVSTYGKELKTVIAAAKVACVSVQEVEGAILEGAVRRMGKYGFYIPGGHPIAAPETEKLRLAAGGPD